MNPALSELKVWFLTAVPRPLLFLTAGASVGASVGGRARGFAVWVGWWLPISMGQGSGERLLPFNNVQQQLCSWAITAFVHHMMGWLPFSFPERAIQPSFITTLCAERKKHKEEK